MTTSVETRTAAPYQPVLHSRLSSRCKSRCLQFTDSVTFGKILMMARTIRVKWPLLFAIVLGGIAACSSRSPVALDPQEVKAAKDVFRKVAFASDVSCAVASTQAIRSEDDLSALLARENAVALREQLEGIDIDFTREVLFLLTHTEGSPASVWDCPKRRRGGL